MDCPPLLRFHIATPNGTAIENNYFSFDMTLEPHPWVVFLESGMLSTNGCSTDNQERLTMLATTTSRFGFVASTMLCQKKIGSIVVFSAGTFDTLRHRLCFPAPQRGHFCRSKQRGSNFRAPRLGFGWELEQRGSVFVLKLASCIAVFGGAWHANNPIEGIGIDQLRILRVFQIVSREDLSVHVASYFGKFLRKDRKTSKGR